MERRLSLLISIEKGVDNQKKKKKTRNIQLI